LLFFPVLLLLRFFPPLFAFSVSSFSSIHLVQYRHHIWVYQLNESRLLMTDHECVADDGKGCKQNRRPYSVISDERGGHFTKPGLIECVRCRAAIPQPRSNVCTLDSRRSAPFQWSAVVTRGRGGDQNKLSLRPAECRTNSTGLASRDSMKCRNDQNHSFLPAFSRAHDRWRGRQTPCRTSDPIKLWLGFEWNDKATSRWRMVVSWGAVTILIHVWKIQKDGRHSISQYLLSQKFPGGPHFLTSLL
jgi:hypothetical protein